MSGNLRRQQEVLLREAELHGFAYERSKRSSHWKIKAPDGHQYVAASTPSDWRGPKNLLAWLRRHGLPREKVSKRDVRVRQGNDLVRS